MPYRLPVYIALELAVLKTFFTARPIILTSTPINTNIPGAAGEQVELTCIVKGKPTPTLSWRRDPKGNDLSVIDENVKSISMQAKAIKIEIIVTSAGNVGNKLYCVATNLLGDDTQEYIIRKRGRSYTSLASYFWIKFRGM